MRKERHGIYRGKPILFSDEKKFTVDGGLNRQNDVVYANSRQEADQNGVLHGVNKYPISVMVWCGLTLNGAIKPYFIEKNTKINTAYYKNRILPTLFAIGTLNWEGLALSFFFCW